MPSYIFGGCPTQTKKFHLFWRGFYTPLQRCFCKDCGVSFFVVERLKLVAASKKMNPLRRKYCTCVPHRQLFYGKFSITAEFCWDRLECWSDHGSDELIDLSLHKKWSFPLRISTVNVTKSAGNCGFGHIYWRNPENFVFCAVILL